MGKNTGRPIQGNDNTTRLINEIKSFSTKYSTLNKEQERAMIEKYKDNREELNRQLILHNMQLVFNIAKKYASKTDDFDGIVQDGMLGLAEAAKRFDVTLDIKFITYAYVWVNKYVLSSFYSKNIKIDKNSISLNSTTFSDKDGESTEFEDYVNDSIEPTCKLSKDIIDDLSANEQEKICSQLFEQLNNDTSLSATDKNVFIDLFYNREKTIDVADKYSLTHSEILDIKHKVLDKFRNILACDYGITEYADVS